MSQKVTRFITDRDPGAFVPQGAVGVGTTISGGDLSGTHGAPIVRGIQGVVISGSASDGEVLTATGPTSADWEIRYVNRSHGGNELLDTIASSGSALTIDLANGNVFDITLTGNCTFALTGATVAVGDSIVMLLRQDGVGSRTVTWPGSVVWPGGTTPTLSTSPAAVDVFVLMTLDGGTTWFGFPTGGSGGGGSSPLTTKGDIYGYSTTNARVAVGADGSLLQAASSQTLGVQWSAPGVGFYGLLVEDGATAPPVNLYIEDGTDWLYSDG